MLRTIGFSAPHKCKSSQAQVVKHRLVYGSFSPHKRSAPVSIVPAMKWAPQAVLTVVSFVVRRTSSHVARNRRKAQLINPMISPGPLSASGTCRRVPLDRLSQYEATLWRQACQILFTLQCLDRRKHEKDCDCAELTSVTKRGPCRTSILLNTAPPNVALSARLAK